MVVEEVASVAVEETGEGEGETGEVSVGEEAGAGEEAEIGEVSEAGEVLGKVQVRIAQWHCLPDRLLSAKDE